MNYQIEKNGKPAYWQLYRQVREDIVKGVYPYGSKLPSKRLTAEEVGVSTVTVEHAYALLTEEGYIESRQRSGYRVIFRPADGFASAPVGPVPAPLPSAAPGPAAPMLLRAMRRVTAERGEALFARSPGAGCPELRQAIAGYLARSRGVTAGEEQIVIGSGSEYLYRLILQLLGRDRIWAIESPSYKQIRQVYAASGVAFEELPLGPEGIDGAALSAAKASVLQVTPFRSFPSGVTASASKRHEYIRWAAEGDRYIIEDDFESEFSVSRKPEETLFALSGGERVIYMNTFSRTLSPSLRAGYMVLPPRLAPVFREKLGFYTCTVPTPVQLLLAELLESGEFERHINRVRRQKRREMNKV